MNSKKTQLTHLPTWCISAVTRVSVPMLWKLIRRLWCQKLASQAGISNYIPQFTVGCNYLSLPEIPASGTKIILYPVLQNLHYSEIPMMPSLIKLAGCLIQPTCPESPCRFELILYTSSHTGGRHSPWIIPQYNTITSGSTSDTETVKKQWTAFRKGWHTPNQHEGISKRKRKEKSLQTEL